MSQPETPPKRQRIETSKLVVQINADDEYMQAPEDFAEAIERCVVGFLPDRNFGSPNTSMPVTDTLGTPVGTFRTIRTGR